MDDGFVRLEIYRHSLFLLSVRMLCLVEAEQLMMCEWTSIMWRERVHSIKCLHSKLSYIHTYYLSASVEACISV